MLPEQSAIVSTSADHTAIVWKSGGLSSLILLLLFPRLYMGLLLWFQVRTTSMR